MASKLDFTKKTFAIITGASQGIGRSMAKEIGCRLHKSSKLLLIARSEQGLLETKKLVQEANNSISVAIWPTDLSLLNLIDCSNAIAKEIEGATFDAALIVHNAGTVGELNKTTELNDCNLWREYYNLNMFSVAILNSSFLKIVQAITQNVYIINMTSLCGRVPFKNLALYGSAKAARELFFKVIAEEEKNIIVLNYSPGPVKTAMVNDIITNVKDDDIRKMFVENKQMLEAEQTVGKLMGILEMGDFKSGDTIDYYDRM